MLRLAGRVANSPVRLAKYVAKNPKWNIPKVALGGYVAYKIFQYAQSDALAFETVRAEVGKRASQGTMSEMEGQGQFYHLDKLKNVLVFLNPASAGGDAGKYFEQYSKRATI